MPEKYAPIPNCPICKIEWLRGLSTNAAAQRIKQIEKSLLRAHVSRIRICADTSHVEKFMELRKSLLVLRNSDKQEALEVIKRDVDMFLYWDSKVQKLAADAFNHKHEILEAIDMYQKLYPVIMRGMRRFNKMYRASLGKEHIEMLETLVKRANTISKRSRLRFHGFEPEIPKERKITIKKGNHEEVIKVLSDDYNPQDYILPDDMELP